MLVLSITNSLLAAPSICGLITSPTILASLNTILEVVLLNTIVVAVVLVVPIIRLLASVTAGVVKISFVPVTLITPNVVVLVVCCRLIVLPSMTRVSPLFGIVGSVCVPVMPITSLGLVSPLVPSGSSISQTRPA